MSKSWWSQAQRILLIYIKSGLSSKGEHAEKPTSGYAPRGGRSAGGRWVGRALRVGAREGEAEANLELKSTVAL